MKTHNMLTGLLLMLALAGCGNSNKSKESESAKETTATKVETTTTAKEKTTEKTTEQATAKPDKEKSNTTVDVYHDSRDHHNFVKGEFPYSGDQNTVPLSIKYYDEVEKINYVLRVHLNKDIYKIKEQFNKDRAGEYELDEFVKKFNDDNIYEIAIFRKGDTERVFGLSFKISTSTSFDNKYKELTKTKIDRLSVSDIYTRKDGLRAYSTLDLLQSKTYTKMRLYLELGGKNAVLLFDFDEDVDPIMQEQVTKDMADAIEIIEPKR